MRSRDVFCRSDLLRIPTLNPNVFMLPDRRRTPSKHDSTAALHEELGDTGEQKSAQYFHITGIGLDKIEVVVGIGFAAIQNVLHSLQGVEETSLSGT